MEVPLPAELTPVQRQVGAALKVLPRGPDSSEVPAPDQGRSVSARLAGSSSEPTEAAPPNSLPAVFSMSAINTVLHSASFTGNECPQHYFKHWILTY